jgi:hypothetical protein
LKRRHKQLAAILFLGACEPRTAERSPTPQDSASPRATQAQPVNVDVAGAVASIQAFYDWYVPASDSNRGGPAWYAAFGRTPPILSSELLQALRADSANKARTPGDLVGLDFDPLLASQDPCARYEVGQGSIDRDTVRLALHAVCNGERSAQPELLLLVTQHEANWLIENVQYSHAQTDLLAILRN